MPVEKEKQNEKFSHENGEPSWLGLISGIIVNPGTYKERLMATKIAKEIETFYNTNDKTFTGIAVYLSPRSREARIYISYEDFRRVRELGSEETESDSLQSLVEWPGSDLSIPGQIKRAVLLSRELKHSLNIISPGEKVICSVYGNNIKVSKG